jgi:hypothetical protein
MSIGIFQQQTLLAPLPDRVYVFGDGFDENTADLTAHAPQYIGTSWGEKEVDGTGDPYLYTSDFSTGDLRQGNVTDGVARYFANPSYEGTVVAQVVASTFGSGSYRRIDQFLLYGDINNHLRIRIYSTANMQLYCRVAGVDSANLMDYAPPTTIAKERVLIVLNISQRALRLYQSLTTSTPNNIADWTFVREVTGLPVEIQSMAKKAGLSTVQGANNPNSACLDLFILYSHAHDYWT